MLCRTIVSLSDMHSGLLYTVAIYGKGSITSATINLTYSSHTHTHTTDINQVALYRFQAPFRVGNAC